MRQVVCLTSYQKDGRQWKNQIQKHHGLVKDEIDSKQVTRYEIKREHNP